MTRSTYRAIGAGLLAALWAASATPAALCQIVNPPGGTTVTWTDDASNGDWQDADNWNVHVPEDGDAVIIDDGNHNAVLHADAERIRSLFVAGGIALYNFGHLLPVGNDDNDATTTVTGNGSAVIISDIPGTGPAFDTDYLDLQSGGELQMDGGRAQVDREIDMSGASAIEGHGVLEVGGGGDAALGFSPTSELTVEGGNLRIDMTGGGTISLGGAFIDVTDENSDLILDGEQFGAIGDTLRIGSGNRADFEGPWEITGALQFVSGGGELVGGSGEIAGTTTVNTSMDARIAGTVLFTSTSTTTVNTIGELELEGHVGSAAGSETTLSYASTLRLYLPPSSAPMPVPLMVWNGELTAWSATIEANQPSLPSQPGFVQFAGDLTLTGSAFWGPTDLQGTAPILLSGNTSVEGPGARVNGAGVQFTSSSNTTIANSSLLEVHSTVRVNSGASITGAGELRVAEGGLLYGEANAAIGVDLVNHGTVRPGAGADYSAHLDATGSYLQFETGALEIDLAGTLTSQYDRLVVGGDAVLDGALEVTLRSGFEPGLGDDFLVLSASDGVAGTFASTQLPAVDFGWKWEVDYSPFAVTLSVIEATADANGDDVVDGADFLVIQRELGAMAPSAGDVTGNGTVDGEDFDLWRLQYGQTVGGAIASATSAAQSAPEPAAGAMGVIMSLTLLATRSRRRAG